MDPVAERVARNEATFRDANERIANAAAAAAKGWGVVVTASDHFVVVEKIGEAGDLAEELQGGA